MKKPIKIYLDEETTKKLIKKANDTGFSGRGALTKFFEKVAKEDICFLDKNLKKMLGILFPSKD